jgi:hypothetical protein
MTPPPASMPAATAPRRVARATRCAAAGIAGAAEEGLRQRSARPTGLGRCNC